MQRTLYPGIIKPMLDFLVAFPGLVILSPFMLLSAVVLAVHFRGNPFFTQIRPGKGGRLFRLVKFRSMKDMRDAHGEMLADHLRLTGLGRIVRATSFDELPQLWNVVKGEMSLIGPRPLLNEYLPLYNDEQQRRHEVRPGITGWAQVNGRNAISWDDRLAMDVWYVDHMSFGMDLKILRMTILKVIRLEKISAGKLLTMQKFQGNG